MTDKPTLHPGRWWHVTDDGRVQCDLCPRYCRLKEGQRGFCFVRAVKGKRMTLTTYGRSSGFCVDPIEKKPLNHFYPGSSVLSFGTAGCNLGCRFCQNWDISKARSNDRLQQTATPNEIAAAARREGCRSVAFTYNDPIIFAEYAIDTAAACHTLGLQTVAVTAGYIAPAAREEFFAVMDAANVDLKGFSERFYHELCLGQLAPVLETLEYLARETSVWLEVTTLLIPGENDSDAELDAQTRWMAEHLGPDVPLHFTAFHPDYRLIDHASTPPGQLTHARQIARANGLRFVYTGNVRDPAGGSTWCPECDELLIERHGYHTAQYAIVSTKEGHSAHCAHCGTTIPGRFAPTQSNPRRH